MIILVGLGNPGNEFMDTPHNLGRLCVECFTEQAGLPDFTAEKKFTALTSTSEVSGQKVVALLPETFMNKSGEAVAAAANFYKVSPENIWAAHDDIDLPLGSVRISFDGGSAGHHGIESIVEKLGTPNFWRFRIGIAPQEPIREPLDVYVLRKNAIETDIANEIVRKTAALITNALENGIAEAQKHGD